MTDLEGRPVESTLLERRARSRRLLLVLVPGGGQRATSLGVRLGVASVGRVGPEWACVTLLPQEQALDLLLLNVPALLQRRRKQGRSGTGCRRRSSRVGSLNGQRIQGQNARAVHPVLDRRQRSLQLGDGGLRVRAVEGWPRRNEFGIGSRSDRARQAGRRSVARPSLGVILSVAAVANTEVLYGERTLRVDSIEGEATGGVGVAEDEATAAAMMTPRTER